MRHAIGWSDLRNQRVGIYGAGVEGMSALGRLESLTQSVHVVDDNPSGTPVGIEITAMDVGGRELLQSCDVVVKSPGISRYSLDVVQLEDAGIPVVGGTGLSIHELDQSQVICITGTKGKSTTSAVLGHLLEGFGVHAVVTGNIGLPLFDKRVPTDADLFVVETSSFQALDIADAPGIVAVTSLGVDHVDWHGSADQYQEDKLSLTSLPRPGITIAQGLSELLRSQAHRLGGTIQWSQEIAGPWAEALGLIGQHNFANAQIAREILIALDVPGADDEVVLSQASQEFVSLPGRLSDAGTVEGVHFVDDSLATNVLPTLAALDSFAGERLALLIGGYDRGVDYTELIHILASREAPTFVIGLPDSGTRLTQAIAGETTTTQVATVDDVAAGVAQGFEWAKANGVVLLSPAAPSFSQFSNWKERSDEFRRCVIALAQ